MVPPSSASASSSASGLVLAFVELLVADWPRAVRWYVEVLGLRLVLDDAPRRFALLEAGAGRLALKGSDAARPARGLLRLTFEAADLDAERVRLLALGVEVTGPTEDAREGYRALRLVDPEGTPITLFRWTSNTI